MPLGIDYNPNNGYIYVANAESSTISIINGSNQNNTVIGSILVGRSPAWLDHLNDKVYVTNYGSEDVYVMDSSAQKVVKVIDVGEKPFGITHDQNENLVYISNLESSEDSSKISVINATIAEDNSTNDAEPAYVPATFEFGSSITGGIKPYNYTWDFGDGNITTSNDEEETVEHTFDKPGKYNVTLTVTDSTGQTISGSKLVTVEEPRPLTTVEISSTKTETKATKLANATRRGEENQTTTSEIRGKANEGLMQLDLVVKGSGDNMANASDDESNGEEDGTNEEEDDDESNGEECEDEGSGRRDDTETRDDSNVVATIELGGNNCFNHFFIAYNNNNGALYLSGFSP